MSKAVYAGRFDPITNGHLWMIAEGPRLFDEVIVAIGVNPDKRYTFDLDTRLAMLRESVEPFDNVAVASFENQYLVNYAGEIGADHIIRGIRNGHDYEYEKGMRHVNADLNADVASLFLIPPRELCEVSSSFAKGLVGPDGWREIVARYVPEPVYRRIGEAADSARRARRCSTACAL